MPRNPKVRALWPEGVGEPFTPLPNLLVEYQAPLGLKPATVWLLVQLEAYRYANDRDPFPSLATLGARMGLTARQVSTLRKKLVDAGLIELHPHYVKGKRTTDRVTRRGLEQALMLIAQNIEHGRDPVEGLASLLAFLRSRATATTAEPSNVVALERARAA